MKIWEAAFYQKSLKRGLSSMMLCFIFSGALLLLTLFFYPKVASSGLRESIEEITRVFPSEMLPVVRPGSPSRLYCIRPLSFRRPSSAAPDRMCIFFFPGYYRPYPI